MSSLKDSLATTHEEVQAQVVDPSTARTTATGVPGISFTDFIVKDAGNRKYLWVALAGMIIQFVVFKSLYPFADFGIDPQVYVLAASIGADFNYWPVGYSKFLYLFHLITHSDTALVFFQYLVVNISFLVFFYSLVYWYKLSVVTRVVLFVFLFLNPLFLYISNNVMSDALFLSGSVLWLTQLLWIIHSPRAWQVWTNGILLALLFTIRYHALYYPAIVLIAFLFSGHSIRQKIAGMVWPLVLMGAFILFTREKAYAATGVRQFSAFSSWQWCNNALYMVPYITIDSTKLPPETRDFHRTVVKYFNTIDEGRKKISPSDVEFPWYLWARISPMMKYFAHEVDSTGHTRYWHEMQRGRVAPVFKAYGLHLIKEHPGAYIQYYMIPNVKTYFFPPLEKLKDYNHGKDGVQDPVTQKWFDYTSMKLSAWDKNFQGKLLAPYPIFFMLLNLVFAAALIRFFVVKTYKQTGKQFLYIILLVGSFFLVNMAFSIFTAPVVFRYQVFPMVVLVAFGVLLIELFLKEAAETGEDASSATA